MMTTPRVIPVVDVMGGMVVHAVAGRRDEYRPIESRITRDVQPASLAFDMIGHTGAGELYVADLDAIRGGSRLSTMVARLLQELSIPVWLDVGIGPSRSSGMLLVYPWVRPVVGLETASHPRILEDTLQKCESRPVAFSLDLNEGRLLGNWSAWNARHEQDAIGVLRRVVDMGGRTVIVLDLARVGMGTGTGTDTLLRTIRGEFPDLELIAGGGVRTWADVNRLGEAGADAVLVATAIHTGSLPFPRPIT
jgi:phosphoribosylformimino-5-aminoimidazole carboxamide ribotide isomerase